jgi:CheY-like chemotaxis protein
MIEGHEGRTPTPIIAMSAGVQPEEIQECTQAGMSDFVAKPVRRAHLLAALCKWIGGSARSASEDEDALRRSPDSSPEH